MSEHGELYRGLGGYVVERPNTVCVCVCVCVCVIGVDGVEYGVVCRISEHGPCLNPIP